MDLNSIIVASRLLAQQRALDVTADNIANANTPGYRTERVLFSDWLSRQTGTSAPPGGKTIAFTQDRATWREQQPGPLIRTGNMFDLAVTGDGYFTVATKNGPRLTRDGRFGRMPDGTLADGSGDAVLDSNGRPILLSPTDTRITIAGDGTLSSESGQLGRIGVVRPSDPMKLAAEGGTLLRADTPTTAVTKPEIAQGAVEGSNVQPVLEVTRMMDNARQFEFAVQFIQAESDRQQGAIDKLLPQGAGA
ncbi:MAG TPA: flagellar hook-basal body complex protein [Acetobacteraceae bacterium]|nr:flagellar hook-basal body complex protein [Acetobacteraceae bacterium]